MNVQLLSDQQLLNSYLSGDQSAISQLIEKTSSPRDGLYPYAGEGPRCGR